MPRSRPPYPPEFRAEAVELIRSGTKSFSQLSRDLGVSDQTLRNWVRQVDVDTGRRHDGLTTSEREELRRLRAENRTLRMERDLLKKVTMSLSRHHRSMEMSRRGAMPGVVAGYKQVGSAEWCCVPDEKSLTGVS